MEHVSEAALTKYQLLCVVDQRPQDGGERDAEEREGSQREWLLWEGEESYICTAWLSCDKKAERCNCQSGGEKQEDRAESQAGNGVSPYRVSHAPGS